MNRQYYSALDRKIVTARRRKQMQESKEAIINAIGFVTLTGAITLGLFFGWLTLGLMFR